ncbi:MAG: hypothetical protein F6K35_29175 [Okeania sp. SIO2H7]|nr:hypothetical protein [Okeania sp. SIO2H7]
MDKIRGQNDQFIDTFWGGNDHQADCDGISATGAAMVGGSSDRQYRNR